MKESLSLPSRQIHLDFHTSPLIPDVGCDFDVRAFANTMRAAHVNSVTVFAKCHHGHLYYDTTRPERHPGLKPGLDLLKEQVDALHRVGIRAPIYISIHFDEYAANTHPEWVARNPDTSQVKLTKDGVFGAGWQVMDMSSPYQDFVAEQTAEILEKFNPVDGIFFDICWDQPSTSKWAIDGMVRQSLDPEKKSDRNLYAHRVALVYMGRFHKMVKESSPDATVYFNSRHFANLAEDIQFLEQVEIEALPTGGWGYLYFPKNVRFARNFSKPYMGMTARFHKSWADFGGLKPYAALEYEISQMMAHGARCSIGDQMHPRGTLDRGAYDLIGKVYERVAAREPWIDGATAVSQIGLFQLPTSNLNIQQSINGSEEGATRMLMQLKHQFDLVSETSDLERYELLILPDALQINAGLLKRLQAYTTRGGALLATGASGLTPDGAQLLLPELGVIPQGRSPFSTTYIRFSQAFKADVPDSDHVMYERGLRVTADEDTHTLACVVEPYFERAWDHFCSHNQTPGDKLTHWAAATLRGRAAYISYPIFRAFATHGNYPYRMLVKNILDMLLPDPMLRVDAPTGAEATVTRQDEKTIVHLLYYSPERRAKDLDVVEDIVPLYDVALSLKLATIPQIVYLAPERTRLDFEYTNGRANVVVPEIRGHAMIVFE